MKNNLSITRNIEQLYRQVQAVIETSRNTVYRAANASMVQAYWNIGRLIVEKEQKGKQKAEYGQQIIKGLSERMQKEYGRGYTITNLKYMRQFYQLFEKSHALRDQLTWTHYRLLLKVEKEEARKFYLEEAIAGNWSTRTLERQINSLYYERMLMSTKESHSAIKQEAEDKKETMQPGDIIKDPYVLEFLNLSANYHFYEKELEQELIDKLQYFLLELGKGFSFISRQYRITTEDGSKHFYIDLVFYNYVLKCFLLVDLKVSELTHQDIGQMDFYVRYFEDKIKPPEDNPTIGLILCTEKDKTIVKYSLLNDSKQIFASKYKLYLPTEEDLRKELEREKRKIEREKGWG